ncbi:hypothetical protein J1N35_025267 [Gossypium stocksii]|uniref:Uncharacterized protein n=1 Tax=Gossypium stocksii TaxID=47602 RepID=A0A9D3V640_9ROSI|nr:hypothetical protein J1N35_025267 [Gossypium stocksii]
MRKTLEVGKVGEEFGGRRRIERGKNAHLFKRRKHHRQSEWLSATVSRERAWPLESATFMAIGFPQEIFDRFLGRNCKKGDRVRVLRGKGLGSGEKRRKETNGKKGRKRKERKRKNSIV